MQWLVTWWCYLLGISDPVAISFAIGSVAAGLLIFLVVAVVYTSSIFLIAWLSR
jgi:hypothetical protein